MNKHHENAKKNSQPLRTIYSAIQGKLFCYESHIHGDDYPIIVFNEKGEDLTDEFDAYDYETIVCLLDEK